MRASACVASYGGVFLKRRQPPGSCLGSSAQQRADLAARPKRAPELPPRCAVALGPLGLVRLRLGLGLSRTSTSACPASWPLCRKVSGRCWLRWTSLSHSPFAAHVCVCVGGCHCRRRQVQAQDQRVPRSEATVIFRATQQRVMRSRMAGIRVGATSGSRSYARTGWSPSCHV